MNPGELPSGIFLQRFSDKVLWKLQNSFKKHKFYLDFSEEEYEFADYKLEF